MPLNQCPHGYSADTCDECLEASRTVRVTALTFFVVMAITLAGAALILKASDMYTSLKLNEAANAPSPVAP